MKKILIITSVASMIEQFMLPNISWLLSMGFEVHVACNFNQGGNITDEGILKLKEKLNEMNVQFFQIDFARNPFKVKELIVSYKQVSKLMSNNYTAIHSHSPVGGIIGRLVGKKRRKNGLISIYTAHGFHFYRGAPILNWLIFYPVESVMSSFTDVLICINKEDYEFAQKHFHSKKIVYIPGIGVNVSSINSIKVDKEKKLEQLGIPIGSKVMISVGEINSNKNHEMIIKAISQINDKKIKYLICGKGKLQKHIETISNDLGVADQIIMLGYREDVIELCKSSDLFVFPSKREGLPVSLMEAMASGLPVVCSNIRGNIDLIQKGGGFLIEPQDFKSAVEPIRNILNSRDLREKLGAFNKDFIENFDISKVEESYKEIY